MASARFSSGRLGGARKFPRRSLILCHSRRRFVFYTDEALKNDAFSCASTYGDFALVIKPKP